MNAGKAVFVFSCLGAFFKHTFVQREDIVGSRLQYEPFFVPRQPVIRSQQFKKDTRAVGGHRVDIGHDRRSIVMTRCRTLLLVP